jgi:NitT/TauT family transport system substrate-binding protein
MKQKLQALTIGTLLLAGCNAAPEAPKQPAASSPTAGGQQQVTPVTIAQFGHVFLYMPLYIAIDRGYFAEEGLDVKLVSTGGDEKTFTAVSTGNAQFGVSDPTFTAIAREHGQGGKVVAAVVRGVPFWIVTLRKDIDKFTKPEEFAGYRIASYTAPSTSYAVMKKLLQNGDKPVSSAKIVQGAFGTLPALLNAGQADMALEIEPMVSIVIQQGGHIVYSPEKHLGDFAFTGLEVSEPFCQEHPEQVQGAVNAIAKAMKFIHDDDQFEDAVQIAQAEFPDVKPQVVRAALARLRQSNTIPLTPALPEGAWNAAIALRKEIGDMSGSGSYLDNVDMQFVDQLPK